MILKPSDKLIFDLEIPPSVNDYYMKTPTGMRINGRSRLWINAQLCNLDEQGISNLKIENTLRMDVLLHPKRMAKMDVDNRMKALLDLFERAKLIEDDDQIQVMHVIKTPVVKQKNGLMIVLQACDLKREIKRFRKLRKSK